MYCDDCKYYGICYNEIPVCDETFDCEENRVSYREFDDYPSPDNPCVEQIERVFRHNDI